jgi:hypothetical protein
MRVHLEADGRLHGGYAVLKVKRNVGRQGDGNAVQQMFPQRAFLWVECGYEQWSAPVRPRDNTLH